jgi:hypothetical protein
VVSSEIIELLEDVEVARLGVAFMEVDFGLSPG